MPSLDANGKYAGLLKASLQTLPLDRKVQVAGILPTYLYSFITTILLV